MKSVQYLSGPYNNLLKIISGLFSDSNPDTVDYSDEIFRAAREQAVSTYVLSYYSESSANGFKSKLMAAAKMNAAVHAAHTEICGALEAAGVPYVVLKGAASSSFYKNPIMRNMGDVDILVEPGNTEKAVNTITSLGFIDKNVNHKIHIGFYRDDITCELHLKVTDLEGNPCREQLENMLSDTIATSVTLKNELTQCRIPDAFHHGLVMLLHMQRHLTCEGIGLRHLCDWAVFVNTFSDEEFTGIFEERLKSVGLWQFAVSLSLAAHNYLDLPYREFFGNDSSLAEELLIDIADGGNFHKNRTNRISEHYFLSDENSGKGRVGRFVHNVNNTITSHWKICRTQRWLLPAGWVFFGIRKIIFIIIGKRKPDKLISAYGSSQRRQDLYDKLAFFRSENR